MKWLLMIVLLTATPVLAQSDEECLRYAVYREGRGESHKTQRAILDTILNRVEAQNTSACVEIRRKGQFPWAKKGIKRVDFYYLNVYHIVSSMEPVLGAKYLYFNTRRHPWGVRTVRIGKLYFSQ